MGVWWGGRPIGRGVEQIYDGFYRRAVSLTGVVETTPMPLARDRLIQST